MVNGQADPSHLPLIMLDQPFHSSTKCAYPDEAVRETTVARVRQLDLVRGPCTKSAVLAHWLPRFEADLSGVDLVVRIRLSIRNSIILVASITSNSSSRYSSRCPVFPYLASQTLHVPIINEVNHRGNAVTGNTAVDTTVINPEKNEGRKSLKETEKGMNH